MYKIFEIVYNSGEWSIGTGHHFYIARNIDEVIQNSRTYQTYFEIQKKNGGDLLVWEANVKDYCSIFENAQDFNFTLNIKPIDKEVKK